MFGSGSGNGEVDGSIVNGGVQWVRSGGIASGTTVLGLAGVARPWHLVVTATVAGIVWSTENATRRRMVGECVEPALVSRALALDTMSNSVTRLIGPLAAGVLYQRYGLGGCFAASACVYAVSAWLGSNLSYRQEKRRLVLGNVPHELMEGLRYVRRDVEKREALANATPSIWPAYGWLTGRFGGRADPFTGEPANHQGIDISTEKGDPVYATADGVVESASWNGDYGNFIVIQHEFGLTTRYGHLNSYRVSPGDTVKRGDTIGYVGSTGRSTGAHLHYEILSDGKLINPLSLLTTPK